MARRILFLSNAPILGGTARILQSWMLFGREAGWIGKLAIQKESDLTDWTRERRIDTLVDPLCWPNGKFPIQALWHAWRVAHFARPVDLIHVNEHDVYPFLFGLKTLINVPVVCHVRYKLERNLAEWLFHGKRCPDALLWTSQQQKSDSAAAVEGIVPEDRQHVVRLGFDLTSYGTLSAGRAATRREWGIRPEEIVIGTASPLRPRKRVHEFIDLISVLTAKHPSVVGLIAGGQTGGDEAYRMQIERRIEATGLGRRLRWLGFLEPVEPFYHACDIHVSTSEYETFGNSVCEAMACAQPVAAYRGGSVAEVVGDSGLIVETGDLGALTAAVERLVVDANLRERLGRAARQRVAEHFDARKSFDQLATIYESLIPTSNANPLPVEARRSLFGRLGAVLCWRRSGGTGARSGVRSL